MAWRDQLRSGSFRGAAFGIEASDRQGGRRLAKHEYPQRDLGYAEDIGRASRVFSIECFVVGEDYFSRRDALIDALETEGPGTLVHPYYGNKLVAVDGFSVRETANEGRVATFTVNFYETSNKATEPTVRDDVLSRVLSRSGTLSASIRDAFTQAYDVIGQPQFAIDSLTAAIVDASGLIRASLGAVLTDPQSLADFTALADILTSDAGTLSRLPSQLADSLESVLAFSARASSRRAAIAADLTIYGFETSELPAAITATRVKEHTNQAALVALIRRQALIEAARLAPAADYDSYDDALAIRNEIVDGLDAEAESASDDVFLAIGALRAELVKAVPGAVNGLARLISVKPPTTTSSLVLAYDLYDDLSLEPDLIMRNRVRHPGFIAGGVPLEVLSRAG